MTPHAATPQQVRQLIASWRADGTATRCDNWMRGYDPAFSKALAGLGVIGMTWPRKYGGGERSNVERLAVTEELLRAGAPVAAHWIADRQIGPAILRHGSEHLRTTYLPGIVTADVFFCLGMSEPEAGSDLASLRTTATPVDGGWRLRGRKIWTTGAHHATHMYVLARTGTDGGKHAGLTEFVLDLGSAGIHISPILDLAGEHHFNEVVFDDVLVPGENVLGAVGNGWRQVVEQLSFERGGPERYLSSYPLLVPLLGSLPDDAEAEQELGRLTARLASLRRLAYQIATLLDEGTAPVRQAATLKYLGNIFEQDVVEFARRFGPNDPPRTSALAQAVFSSPGYTVRGGAADVMLSLIARAEVSS
ncbi:acyl-CoA dehydrogenase family protein [Dactylosporangium sp. NPDC005572]|uniref:acyl-CoA dehydrogenase family protein n=1 Tax=Dactylosporangium sp. NPDC005572 TaxID=3156889 RepID=UPI00339F5C0C